jgi:hypothetical protein
MPEIDKADGEVMAQQNFTDHVLKSNQSCRLQALGPVEQWKNDVPLDYPKKLNNEMLYKCRQMFIVVLLR